MRGGKRSTSAIAFVEVSSVVAAGFDPDADLVRTPILSGAYLVRMQISSRRRLVELEMERPAMWMQALRRRDYKRFRGNVLEEVPDSVRFGCDLVLRGALYIL
jgi:hypothetical protein